MSGAHQVPAQILAGADQVAQTLSLHGRDRDAMKLDGDQQSCQ